MATHELGSPAYKKYDVEAWMPGNQFYGEVINHFKMFYLFFNFRFTKVDNFKFECMYLLCILFVLNILCLRYRVHQIVQIIKVDVFI